MRRRPSRFHLAPACLPARVTLLLAFLLALGSAGRGVAQAGPAASPRPADAPPRPSCAAELAWVAEYAARNYAGHVDKVTPAVRPAYAALLDTLTTPARRATSPVVCDMVLGRWTAFFRDRHLTTTRRVALPATSTGAVGSGARLGAPARDIPCRDVPDTSPAAVRARFAAWPRSTAGGRPLDETTAVARLAALGAARDPIEGVWESAGGPGAVRYRVAVLRDGMLDAAAGAPPAAAPPPAFTMLVLRADSAWWTPGQVKARVARDTVPVLPTDVRVGVPFTYRATLYLRDHTPEARVFRAGPLMLLVGNGERWLRR